MVTLWPYKILYTYSFLTVGTCGALPIVMKLTNKALSVSRFAVRRVPSVAKLASSGQFVVCEDGEVIEQRPTAFPKGAMLKAIRFNDPFQDNDWGF
jgi:hypothetical protein